MGNTLLPKTYKYATTNACRQEKIQPFNLNKKLSRISKMLFNSITKKILMKLLAEKPEKC